MLSFGYYFEPILHVCIGVGDWWTNLFSMGTIVFNNCCPFLYCYASRGHSNLTPSLMVFICKHKYGTLSWIVIKGYGMGMKPWIHLIFTLYSYIHLTYLITPYQEMKARYGYLSSLTSIHVFDIEMNKVKDKILKHMVSIKKWGRQRHFQVRPF